jgi:hypothetical protein
VLEVGGRFPAFLSVSASVPSVLEHFQKDDLVWRTNSTRGGHSFDFVDS